MNTLGRAHVSKLLHLAIAAAATVISVAACTENPTNPAGSSQEQADGAAGSGSGAASGADSAAASDAGTRSIGDDSGAGGTNGAATGGRGDAGDNTDAGKTMPDAGHGTDAGSAGTDAGAVCVTSAAKGSCGPYLYPAISGSDRSNTTVGQDVWNPISGWSQTLYATTPGNWYVTASMPAGNTAVVSFPNTGESYNSNLLTGFSSIYSSFSENMSPTVGTSAEAAYDIWLNNWNNEVMIQHDMVKRGGPCGPVLATATFGGPGGVPVQNWNLCQYGSELIWQLPGNGEQSGSVDILAMLNWLVNNGGYLPHASSLTAISYGFEICSTGGVDENFQVKGFSITSSP
jgi:hypothetical protein